jgi:hypothetical protein
MVRSINLKATQRLIIGALSAFVVLAAIPCSSCKRAGVTSPPAAAEAVEPWKEAADKVEQDRGEPVGVNATVEVPEQLKHYADRRRFLAVQAADARARADVICRDFADLVPLIHRGELVEMKPLGSDYILYGVGESAVAEPFAHYDSATGQDIPLRATEEEMKGEVQQASGNAKETAVRLAYLEAARRRAPKRDRARRATLSAELAHARKVLKATESRSGLLAAFYSDAGRRKAILAEYQMISDLARDFDGEAYDLNDPDSRRRLKTRLLSFIRPEARDVLSKIAHDYKEKFNRPLPVSSLVRPVQYQRELARRNPNATRDATPPHSTGLAFDLYYKYMSAAEQEFLMSVIAQLKNEGRVEALREARDNIHAYVFGSGRRPDDTLIASVITEKQSRNSTKKSRAPSRGKAKSRKRGRRG